MASQDEPLAASALIVPPGHTGRAPWTIIGLLMAVSAFIYFNRINMPIASDERIMAQYSLSPETMGWVYSSLLITYTICMIPGGWFIDRFGAKNALSVVVFGSALFTALTGVVGWVAPDGRFVVIALLLVRGLMGVVTAPIYPSCARLVGYWMPAGSRSLANGLVTGAALVGIAITPPVFGAMISRFGWPLAFLIAGVLTAALAAAWTHYGAEQPPATAKLSKFPDPELAGDLPADLAGPSSGWGALLCDRSLVLLSASYAAIGYFQYLFFYWMNYYFQKKLGLPVETGRFYAAVPPLAMAVGMPLGGWVSDRLEHTGFSRKIVPMAGMGAGAALLGLGLVTHDPRWIVAWFSLALGAVGAAEGPFWVTAIERGGRRGGSAAALMNTVGNAGGILAPILTPWVGQRYGWPSAVILGSLVCVAGLFLWLGIDTGRKASDAET